MWLLNLLIHSEINELYSDKYEIRSASKIRIKSMILFVFMMRKLDDLLQAAL